MSIDSFISQDGPLRYFASREAVIVGRTPSATHKLARVSFGSDGSIYVQFPYCKAKFGILAELPVDPSCIGPVTYDLSQQGIRVRTDFKFSHHRSGIARFSKSGHDLMAPRRRSFPLDGPIGHVFQLQIHHLGEFDTLDRADKRAIYFGFEFSEDESSAVLIRAEWRRKAEIISSIIPPGGTTGPVSRVIHRDTGLADMFYFLGQPASLPLREHLLLISGHAVAVPDGASQSGMVFFGGWDTHEQAPGEPPARLGSCLTFLYPAEDAPVA